jgi:hypothetical protein
MVLKKKEKLEFKDSELSKLQREKLENELILKIHLKKSKSLL